MKGEHPELEQLQTYLRDTDAAEMAPVRMHLLGCAECRQQVDTLSVLEQHHSSLGDTTSLSDEQHQLIMEYVDDKGKNTLDGEIRTKAQRLLNEQPAAMRAALHYAGHSHDMPQRSVTTKPVAQVQPDGDDHTGLLSRLGSLLPHRSPLWLSIPATAFSLAALAFILLQYHPALQDNTRIAVYQDNPVIQFRDNVLQPGIGFFRQSARTDEAYAGVRVDIVDTSDSELTLRMQWPAVAAAVRYDMRLQAFDTGEKKVLGRTSTSTNSAVFKLDRPATARRYEWILSGETSDDRTFYTTGGFVINRPDG